MGLYDGEFHKDRHENTIKSAEIVLSIIQEILPRLTSGIDLGCGVGTWLHVLEKYGCKELCGIDGPWVNKDQLRIRREQFIEHDLGANPSPNLNKSFDLAISLEVAEHLTPHAAKAFIATLTQLSDFVLFSAAIPNQGGVGHVNEQWPPYWISLFEDNEFVAIDIIRKRIWDNSEVMRQYRQNVLFFVNSHRIKDLNIHMHPRDHVPAEIYSLAFEKAVTPGIKKCLYGLFAAINNRLGNY